jgi:uncharacterized protein DUF1353
MPDPKSIIPSSQSADLATLLQKPSVAPPPAAFQPGAPEAVFLTHFPLPYKVQAVTIYEAKRKGWPTDRSYWQFLDPFRYVSAKWGPINIPTGSYTDFASVPPSIHSIIDDDSPIILFPSAPHDFLFTKRSDKNNTRGWVNDQKQLTLTQVNHVLTEAMAICGANLLTQNVVFAAVELANQPIRGEFAP